jgi:hypothetical protein
MYPYVEALCAAVAVIGCFIGLVFDLETKRIPNKLTGAMLMLSVPLALLRVFSGDIPFLWLYLANFFFGFAVGILLWFIQAWSGGDAKMFWALCALMPVRPEAFGNFSAIGQPYYGSYFFGITILFNLALLLLLRFFIAAAFMFLSERRVGEFFGIVLAPFVCLMASSLFGIGLQHLTKIPYVSYVSMLVIPGLSLMRKRSGRMFLLSSLVLIAIGAVMAGVGDVAALISLIVAEKTIFSLAFILSAYAAGSAVPLTHLVGIRDLKKGMSISEEIYMRENALAREDASSSLWGYLSSRTMDLGKKKRDYLVRPMPAGLDDEDIEKLRLYEKQLGGAVKVNAGFPLMPFMFAAVIVSFFADLFWLMLS